MDWALNISIALRSHRLSMKKIPGCLCYLEQCHVHNLCGLHICKHILNLYLSCLIAIVLLFYQHYLLELHADFRLQLLTKQFVHGLLLRKNSLKNIYFLKVFAANLIPLIVIDDLS